MQKAFQPQQEMLTRKLGPLACKAHVLLVSYSFFPKLSPVPSNFLPAYKDREEETQRSVLKYRQGIHCNGSRTAFKKMSGRRLKERGKLHTLELYIINVSNYGMKEIPVFQDNNRNKETTEPRKERGPTQDPNISKHVLIEANGKVTNCSPQQ